MPAMAAITTITAITTHATCFRRGRRERRCGSGRESGIDASLGVVAAIWKRTTHRFLRSARRRRPTARLPRHERLGPEEVVAQVGIENPHGAAVLREIARVGVELVAAVAEVLEGDAVSA